MALFSQLPVESFMTYSGCKEKDKLERKGTRVKA